MNTCQNVHYSSSFEPILIHQMLSAILWRQSMVFHDILVASVADRLKVQLQQRPCHHDRVV